MGLKELRLKAGLSQSDVAMFLTVDQSAVSQWESGKFNPVKRFHKPLAKLYHVSVDELLAAFTKKEDGRKRNAKGKPNSEAKE